jgi:mono/diheme cytochrome c family protein
MRYRWLAWLPALPILALATSAAAPPAADEPDEEERQYRAAVARRALEENCLICHAEDMIKSQRLTPAQWKAEVEKMVGWGAPLPKEQQDLLIDDLSSRYSDKTPAVAPAHMRYEDALTRILPTESDRSSPTGDADRGAKLYAVNCASCHGPDAQGAELGPNLVEKPVLYRPADYNEVVRKGRGRMPGAQAVLMPDQQADILAWLRTRRYTVQ